MTIPQISLKDTVACYEIQLAGRVQAVGFRPFVYHLAKQLQVKGQVSNVGGEVHIVAQGEKKNIDKFLQALIKEAPEISRPRLVSSQAIDLQDMELFRIMPSTAGNQNEIHVPPDYFICKNCLQELNDPGDRRYHYPFINCTQCGPRYTLIESLPYDRNNTSMSGFSLCAECEREYRDPGNRRYHAEPLACPECGPAISFKSGEASIEGMHEALGACISALDEGKIVAIKGVGGYHLCCDAQNEFTVNQLRKLKSRPHKPLAIMFPEAGEDGLQQVKRFVQLEEEGDFLASAVRPVLLLDKQQDCKLPEAIAPGLEQLGVMLPYSPLHHLILNLIQRPLIVTSANISGEPVLTDNREIESRLSHITHNFLHHDRPIVRPADDSVFRYIAKQPRPIRIGRGQSPLELTLPFSISKPMLACGGYLKNTVALAFDNRLIISPHIGDMGSLRSQMVFEKVISDLQTLYQTEPEIYVCDAHPDYSTSRWARRQNRQLVEVFHHHAHASCLSGEFPDESRWLAVSWDGVGYGMDGTLWGGETFYGQAGNWIRVASMRPFHLPGGDKAARNPFYSEMAINWELGRSVECQSVNNELLFTAWKKRINTTTTSSVGRLFDAAAATLGLCESASYEGHAAMLLETRARQGNTEATALPVVENTNGLLSTDWEPLFKRLRVEKNVANAAYEFHAALAKTILVQAELMRNRYGDFAVGLTGGVFQNKLLSELTLDCLKEAGFRAYLPARVPVNDGGLCYGQIVEAAMILEDRHD